MILYKIISFSNKTIIILKKVLKKNQMKNKISKLSAGSKHLENLYDTDWNFMSKKFLIINKFHSLSICFKKTQIICKILNNLASSIMILLNFMQLAVETLD